MQLFKFPEKKWVTLRLYGDVHSYATAWVKTKTKDGKSTKFPVDLPSYDPETQQFDSTKYDPWYAHAQHEKDSGVERDDQLIQVGRKFYMNALFRHLQKQQPSTKIKPTSTERETGFKDKDSDTWTPWQVVALSPTLIGKIKELKGLNTVTSKKTGATKTYSVTDPKFGRDIRIFFDGSKAPADQYQVIPADTRSALDEEELSFLRWDTSCLAAEPLSDEETKREFESWAKRNGVKLKKGKAVDADDIDEDEDDEPPKKGKKTPAKGKKKVVEEDEDDEDEDEDGGIDDEDEDDDEPPKKSKGKKKPVEDDEDEDEDDDGLDDEDEDEDDEPPKKSKKQVKSKKKPVDEDDEDEDEDDDLEDEDEDDEPPKSKKKAPAKGKKKPVDEAEDDEDDDLDEDEDDEDEPPKKSKKPVKGKKKPVEDDEDEDEDLDDEDEDEDEPPKKKKAPAKKVAAKKSKKKPVEEDEDEDEDDDLDD